MVQLIGSNLMMPPRLAKRIAQPPSWFDRRYDVDTDQFESLADAEVSGAHVAHGNANEAIPFDQFEALTKALPSERERYTFIGVGSGKGRVVLLAAA